MYDLIHVTHLTKEAKKKVDEFLANAETISSLKRESTDTISFSFFDETGQETLRVDADRMSEVGLKEVYRYAKKKLDKRRQQKKPFFSVSLSFNIDIKDIVLLILIVVAWLVKSPA